MIDLRQNGCISLAEFSAFNNSHHLCLSANGLKTIITRYGRQTTNVMSFSEFAHIFIPISEPHRNTLLNRPEQNIHTFSRYSNRTKLKIKHLLTAISNCEANFQIKVGQISEGNILDSDEIFNYMDKHKDGFVTRKEFGKALKESNINCGEKEAKEIFDQFDRNNDGRITFEEFHSPAKKRRD